MCDEGGGVRRGAFIILTSKRKLKWFTRKPIPLFRQNRGKRGVLFNMGMILESEIFRLRHLSKHTSCIYCIPNPFTFERVEEEGGRC